MEIKTTPEVVVSEKVTAQIRAGLLSVEDLVQLIVTMHSEQQPLEAIHAAVREFLHDNGNHTRCFNCDASMLEVIYEPSLFHGLLLIRMAEQVRDRQAEGKDFTAANHVHVPSLPTTDGIRHAVTQASYLNLVAQPEKARNTGIWVITGRGWAALRGEPIPKTVTVFRGHIEERGTETITLAEIFKNHSDRVEKAIAKKRAVKRDHRAAYANWDPIEWREFGKVHEGKLF